MSYCRFSTNSFRCDVYVYESSDIWVVHVARNKVVLPDDFPDEPSLEDVGAWVKHYQLLQQVIDTAQRVPLNLGHDGEMFLSASLGECADTLTMLAGLGYRIPPSVITELRQEQEKIDVH